jgi:endoribonuclease Dicer
MSTFISSTTKIASSSLSSSSSSSSTTTTSSASSLSLLLLSPRQYQIDAALYGIHENSIINIKTGGGKTLIAVIIMNHYLSINNGKKVLFIVPSRALVQQQAEYFQKHCKVPQSNLSSSTSSTTTTTTNSSSLSSSSNKIRIAQLCGNEIESWNKSNWNHAMNNYDIMVGTPEVFRRALVDQRYILSSQFSLVIFDECHNATG